RAYDDKGNYLGERKPTDAAWLLPTPPLPAGAKQPPPPLRGMVVSGKLTVPKDIPNQHGYVEVKADGAVAKARVRVVPLLPYRQDFEKVPDGAVPGGWINTQGKFVVATINGNKVLRKVNNKASPLFARGNA